MDVATPSSSIVAHHPRIGSICLGCLCVHARASAATRGAGVRRRQARARPAAAPSGQRRTPPRVISWRGFVSWRRGFKTRGAVACSAADASHSGEVPNSGTPNAAASAGGMPCAEACPADVTGKDAAPRPIVFRTGRALRLFRVLRGFRSRRSRGRGTGSWFALETHGEQDAARARRVDHREAEACSCVILTSPRPLTMD